MIILSLALPPPSYPLFRGSTKVYAMSYLIIKNDCLLLEIEMKSTKRKSKYRGEGHDKEEGTMQQ